MNKVLLIIQREYLTRVKKKSFLLMTFLVPALIIAMYALIAYLSVNGADKATEVQVYDESGIFTSEFKNTETVSFSAGKTSFAEAKKEAATNEEGFILHIPKDIEQLHHLI